MGFFGLFFAVGIFLNLSVSHSTESIWGVLIGGLIISLMFVARNVYVWLQMNKRRERQKFGMYIFPTAVIFYYPKRLLVNDCRYFPKKGISEIIIDDYLDGGYDQPVQLRCSIQFYFSYLSLKRKSMYVFSDFPFDQGGRIVFEELNKWLQKGNPTLPSLNHGKRV